MAKTIYAKANMPVAGVTFENRQNKLMSVLTSDKCYISLRRERNNKYDPNAIQVLAHTNHNGQETVMTIGYVPKDKAFWLAKAMDTGKTVKVSYYKIVGNKKQNLGCRLTVLHEMTVD